MVIVILIFVFCKKLINFDRFEGFGQIKCTENRSLSEFLKPVIMVLFIWFSAVVGGESVLMC